MTAARNEHLHRSITFKLAVLGMVMVASGALVAAGMDTPIVIAGGSIHFRAKRSSGWATCDGSTPSSTTTCYKSDFSQTDKGNTNNYQFLNDYDLNAVAVPMSRTGGPTAWEIDVVDTNPGNKPSQPMQDGVKVCAESSPPYTSCKSGAFTSGSIYVIAVNGAFSIPDATGKKILFYDNSDKEYNHISNIVLNVGATNVVTEPCNKSRCAVFLSN